MEAQNHKESDEFCKELENLMTREIEETLERHCEVNIYYGFHDAYHCVADTDYYGTTIHASYIIPAKDLRDLSQDNLREMCVDYAGTIATCLKDAIWRIEHEKGGEN